jgi:hypothetical protein
MGRWIIGLLVFGWVQSGFALPLDVGMLTQVDGKVDLIAQDRGTEPATAFLKVANGDKLILGEGARVQIAYFVTSRQEVWQGAGEVGIIQGRGCSATLKPETRRLPPLLARQLAKTPAGGKHGKIGMVRMRSLSSDTLESLDKQYQEFRRAVPPDDVTPEVFLLNGLLEIKEYAKALSVIEKLRARVSRQPAMAGVIAHFEPLVQSESAKP